MDLVISNQCRDGFKGRESKDGEYKYKGKRKFLQKVKQQVSGHDYKWSTISKGEYYIKRGVSVDNNELLGYYKV